MTFTYELHLDGDVIRHTVERETKTAQQKLDAVVLQDSNYYVPKDTGKLEESGILNTVIGSGEVIWRTPYARAQYYGTAFSHLKQRNPNACAKWFEAAKARFMKKWEKLVNDSIKHN